MKYASFKMWIADKYHYKDGYAIWLVVRKDNKRKVMALGIYAEPHQWDDKQNCLSQISVCLSCIQTVNI